MALSFVSPLWSGTDVGLSGPYLPSSLIEPLLLNELEEYQKAEPPLNQLSIFPGGPGQVEREFEPLPIEWLRAQIPVRFRAAESWGMGKIELRLKLHYLDPDWAHRTLYFDIMCRAGYQFDLWFVPDKSMEELDGEVFIGRWLGVAMNRYATKGRISDPIQLSHLKHFRIYINDDDMAQTGAWWLSEMWKKYPGVAWPLGLSESERAAFKVDERRKMFRSAFATMAGRRTGKLAESLDELSALKENGMEVLGQCLNQTLWNGEVDMQPLRDFNRHQRLMDLIAGCENSIREEKSGEAIETLKQIRDLLDGDMVNGMEESGGRH
jgi:hypothetical protein